MRRTGYLAAIIALAWVAPGCEGGGGDVPDGGGIVDTTADLDGDHIADGHEGYQIARDTDGDGRLDAQDLDSDADEIPDHVEAGDLELATPPLDSDGDGLPNAHDIDSDDNGIPDRADWTDDFEMDGIPNYADLDDDGDGVRDIDELGGVITPATDSDGDGAPNYRDADSDNDNILDGDEFGVDTDRDGLRDFEDVDTDSDTRLDVDEAGDRDIRTPPIDSDDDGILDFRDPDSDNDGLSDGDEVRRGTSPIRLDTDDDGVSDLIEVAAGTNPMNGEESPLTRGDFVFVVPYEEAPTPPRDTLEFRTSIQFADVYFLFDISGSMDGEIAALRADVSGIAEALTCEDYGTHCSTSGDCGSGQVCGLTGSCIADPSTTSCITSPFTGGGYYEAELTHLLSPQPDPEETATALDVATFGGTESLFRAVWGALDPTVGPGSEVGCSVDPLRIGCIGYRPEAVKIFVAFTDEDSDGTETVAEAAAALIDQGVTFIGVWSGSPTSAERQALVDLATASDSLTGDGTPLVFDADGATAGSVRDAVTAAINEVVEGVPLRVTIIATDEPEDAGDALQFIDYLEINGTTEGCTAVDDIEDTDGDGRPDAFRSILPGTPVCWDIVALQNDHVPPTPEPQVFKARVTVRGDGSPLDGRIVYFLVPPEIPPPGGPI